MLNLLSWVSTVAILVAFFILAKKPDQLRMYLWVNLAGSGILAYYNIVHATWQNLVLNIAFGLISAWGLWCGRKVAVGKAAVV
jgi:hypothetical protein